MNKIKVFYKGMYDDGDCRHYVLAKNRGDYLVISYRQWKNCLKNRKIGGDAEIFFDTEKPVFVLTNNSGWHFLEEE